MVSEALVGDTVGKIDGLLVATTEVVVVGDIVGVSIGLLVGPFVGSRVGRSVGTRVGSFVGLFVGPFVGSFVGPFVGSFAVAITVVGDSVGLPKAVSSVPDRDASNLP